MGALLLVTVLSCEQVYGFISKLEKTTLLSPEQKIGILLELKKVVPTCPVVIKTNGKR